MDNSLNFQYNLASCSPFKDNSPKTIQRIFYIDHIDQYATV